MDSYNTDEFLDAAKKAKAENATMVYHPSIKKIVRYLARRAAERDYDNQLAKLADRKPESVKTERSEE